MLTDLRYALTALRRSPGFVVAAVLCLGLGLGANVTVFSFVNALAVRPLPYANADQLVAVQLAQRGGPPAGSGMSVPYLLDLRARTRTMSTIVAYGARRLSLVGREGPVGVTAAEASAEFFDVLGVRPLVGRGFRPDESTPGAPAVAVLGEALWRERFGADPRVAGTSVTLDGIPTVVVGVMPARVGLLGDREQLWMPVSHDPNPADRDRHRMYAIGRLRDGMTPDDASRELRAIGARLAVEHPETDREWAPSAIALRESLVPPEITLVFGVMLGAVSFVLVIACANVANLLLARTAVRARELALRVALGAGRLRVVRLVLTECVLVSLAGGALAVGVARFGTAGLRRSVPVVYPAWLHFDVDGRVVAYAVGLSIVTGVVFGLLPALRASRPSLSPTLREGGRGASAGTRRVRDALVAGELALSLVLLVGAGLMIKSVTRLANADPGFEPAGVLAARVYIGGERYATAAARVRLAQATLERAAALPGVAQASIVNSAPLSGSSMSAGVLVEGQPVAAGREPEAQLRTMSAGLLSALRVPLLAGRAFTAAEALDNASAGVIVNERMARRFWPAGTAVGRRIAFVQGPPNASGAPPAWLTVIGVAHDVSLTSESADENQVWRPWAAAPGRSMTVMLRTNGDPAALAPAVRRLVGEIDPTVPVVDVDTMEDVVHESLWRQRLYGWLFGAFAAAALLLAVVGVYGVIAYQVTQRRRELGVRVALGASAADVYRLVVGDGARLAVAGLGVGLVLAFALTRVLRSALHEVSATDPAIFGGVTLSLAAAALLASWLPARRAGRVHPIEALRDD